VRDRGHARALIFVAKPSVCNGFVATLRTLAQPLPFIEAVTLKTGAQSMVKRLLIAGAMLLGGIETLSVLTLICRS